MSILDTTELCGAKTVDRGFNQGTASGKPFWALDPRPEDIRITDIAAQLARVCRFGGALRDNVEHYSVAQHSVLVSYNVPEEFALEGLLHDAAEAYTGDMLKPLKHALPDFKRLSDNIDIAIRKKFGLPLTPSPCIKEADYRAVLTERRDVLPEVFTVDWGVARAEPWPEIIVPWYSRAARWCFLERFIYLTGGRELVD